MSSEYASDENRILEIFFFRLKDRGANIDAFKYWYNVLSTRPDFNFRKGEFKQVRRRVGPVDIVDFQQYRKHLQVREIPVTQIKTQEEKESKKRLKIADYKDKKRFESNLPAYTFKELKEMPYAQYLHTAHWIRVRDKAILEAKGACRLCNSRLKINVHHRSYFNKGREQSFDVVALCEACHQAFHKWYGKPIDS